MRLCGQQTLITGAASGIGAATTRRFVAEGAQVWAVDRDQAALQALVDELAAGPGTATALAADVTDDEALRQLAAAVHQRCPDGLDILVNNAGVGAVGTVLQTAPATLDRLYAVNVRAPYALSQQFLPRMIERRRGAILNVASIGGLMALRDRAAYCTTKFALVGLTKAMALDHAASGVRVNCVCPARVETPFVQARIREYPDPAEAYRQLSSAQPLGRMARPAEIAAALLYLADDEAAFVTGAALVIDGGMSAGQ